MGNLIEICVPDIGDFEQVEIIEMLVAAGDRVVIDQSLVTLESNKAIMELPSEVAGRVAEVKVKVGDKVSEGTPILLLEELATTFGHEAAPTPDSAPKPTESTAPEPRPAPSSVVAIENKSEPALDDRDFPKAHASPSVRRFARELGADITQIKGTGSKGRVLKEDVQTWIKQTLSTQEPDQSVTTDSGIPPIPDIDFSQFGSTETVTLSRIKRVSGPHLHRVWLNMPMVTNHIEADITELESFRRSLKDEAEQQGTRLTLLAFIMKSLVSALSTFPNFNASLSSDGQSLIYKKYFHIGIAVDTENGLVVPVIRDVEQKSVYQLSVELADVSTRARAGKLTPADLCGGCISISSLGSIGGSTFTPIVNAPEVAILGVGRANMQPVWNDKEFVPRLMLPLSLSYDHRAIDGAEAARFLAQLCQTLNDIRRLLL